MLVGNSGRRRAAAIAITAMAVAVLAGCSSSGSSSSGGSGSSVSASGVIKIGMSNPMSGPASADCGPTGSAVKAWLTHINSSGGINGRQISLQLLDDQYTAPMALSNARAMDQNGDVAILGGCGSTPASTIAPYAAQNNMPFLFPLAPDLTSLVNPVQKSVFALFPQYSEQIPLLIKSAAATYGTGSVYLVDLEATGADPTAAAVQAAATADGEKFLGTDYIAPTAADLTPDALKIKAAHPDYLVLVIGSAQAGELIHALQTQNALPAKKILGTGLILNSAFVSAVGSAASQVLASSPIPPSTDPRSAQCAGVLNAAGVPLTTYSLWGCTEAQVLVTALKGIKGTISRASVIAELDGWNAVQAASALAPVTYTATNHAGPVGVYELGVQSGKVVVVKSLGS